MPMQNLYDLYVDMMLEDYTPLEDFVERVESGEFGKFSKNDRVTFLRQVESNMLANVETQIAAHPHLEERRYEVVGDIRARIQGLIDQLKE
jgi:hypothetical protein